MPSPACTAEVIGKEYIRLKEVIKVGPYHKGPPPPPPVGYGGFISFMY